MSKYLNHNATLQCTHGGQVMMMPPPMRSLWIMESPVVTDVDLYSAIIVGCPQIGPGLTPCINIVSILMGLAIQIEVDGETPILSSLEALTDGCPPGFVSALDDGGSNAEPAPFSIAAATLALAAKIGAALCPSCLGSPTGTDAAASKSSGIEGYAKSRAGLGSESDDKSKSGSKPDIGVDYNWATKSGAAKQWGDDKNNFQLGAYSASLSSGISKTDGGIKADLISGSAEVSAIKASGEKKLLGGAANVQGDAEVLSASASADVGAEYSDTKKAIEAQAGAEVNLAKAQAGGEIEIPIPFTDQLLTVGGNVEGQIGASAEASAGAGWTQQEGYFLEAKAKAGLGLGAGAGFTIGLKKSDG